MTGAGTKETYGITWNFCRTDRRGVPAKRLCPTPDTSGVVAVAAEVSDDEQAEDVHGAGEAQRAGAGGRGWSASWDGEGPTHRRHWRDREPVIGCYSRPSHWP